MMLVCYKRMISPLTTPEMQIVRTTSREINNKWFVDYLNLITAFGRITLAHRVMNSYSYE